jgi:hypothetical protein
MYIARRTAVTLTKYVLQEHMDKKVQGEKVIKLGSPKRRGEDLRGKWCEVAGWIHLAQDTDKWQALVNRVMNLRVP